MPFHFSPKFVGVNQPIRAAYDGNPVTPADGTDLPSGPGGASTPCVGLYVTGAGNVNVDLASGGTAVLTGLAAGQIVDCAVKRVRSTSTTATGIFALYAPLG